MKKLLTLPHWQLFLLIIVMPILIQVIPIFIQLTGELPSYRFYLLPLLMCILTAPYFGWLYALGTNLYARLPNGARMNLTWFKVCLFVPMLYIFSMSVMVTGVFVNDDANSILEHSSVVSSMILLHFFSMYGIFYCIYFNAKALKSVESQLPVTFSNFAGEFFFMWLFPFGIWFIQPRINELFVSEEHQNQ